MTRNIPVNWCSCTQSMKVSQREWSILALITSYREVFFPVFLYSASRLISSRTDSSSAIRVRVASSGISLGAMMMVATSLVWASTSMLVSYMSPRFGDMMLLDICCSMARSCQTAYSPIWMTASLPPTAPKQRQTAARISSERRHICLDGALIDTSC